MHPVIRPARETDAAVIYEMLRKSAIEQGGEQSLCVTPENLMEDGFSANPRFSCLIAEVDGDPAGLALYFFIYSTWTSRRNLYLEDLYVKPEYRRQGIARLLMEAVKREAGGAPIRWVALRHNEAASAFYASLGAEPLEDWVLWRWQCP